MGISKRNPWYNLSCLLQTCAIWAPVKNCPLADSFLRHYISCGGDWRNDVVNWCLELGFCHHWLHDITCVVLSSLVALTSLAQTFLFCCVAHWIASLACCLLLAPRFSPQNVCPPLVPCICVPLLRTLPLTAVTEVLLCWVWWHSVWCGIAQ